MHTTTDMTATFTADECVGMTVNQYLFELRLTKTQLGKILGVPQPSVSKRIAGQVAWSAQDLILAADWLGVALTDLAPVRNDEHGWLPAPFVPGKAKGPIMDDRTFASTPSGTRTLDPQIKSLLL